MNLEHLVAPESKEVLKKEESKRMRACLREPRTKLIERLVTVFEKINKKSIMLDYNPKNNISIHESILI